MRHNGTMHSMQPISTTLSRNALRWVLGVGLVFVVVVGMSLQAARGGADAFAGSP